jgi:hypothetical protein
MNRRVPDRESLVLGKFSPFAMKYVILIALVALLGILFFPTPLSYFYCLARESSWMQAKTRAEMEERLIGFYSESEITPKVAGWGMGHQLKQGETMIRYMILGKEPLDVVYAGDGNVVAIYTSYE